MMWFFAILIVLAMGGVAAVAAGYGRPMGPAYDDRPDALVPRDRPLRPSDIRRVRLSTALFGYRMSEVDTLLQRIASELAQAQSQTQSQAQSQAAEPPSVDLPSRPPGQPPSQPPAGRQGGSD